MFGSGAGECASGAAEPGAVPAGEAGLCIVAPNPGPPLEEFGRVLRRWRLVLRSGQAACLGDLFYEEGSTLELGLLTSRFRDRLYLRTPRRILREWVLPSPGQPDSAVAWSEAFMAGFATGDSLFVDLRLKEEPFLARGSRGARTGLLFRHWVAHELTAADCDLATRLGVPPSRLLKPPPEPVCPPGGG